MATLGQVIKDIKTLKIQGASHIAEAGLKAFDKAKNKKAAARALMKARPTEPMLFNVLKLAKQGIPVKELLNKLKEDRISIAKHGAKLIRKGTIVFTHCHSSSVVDILKEAKKQGKKFEVHNTETRPLYQGRTTAKELAKAGIKIIHHVDSAAMHAMKEADLFLFGADAITTKGVYNKIGTNMFAEVAKSYFKDKVYCCSHSWKFAKTVVEHSSTRPRKSKGFSWDVKVEQRNANEIWKGAPKKVIIHNPAFVLVEPKFIDGIISELGIIKFKHIGRSK